ncbi:MAG: DoxX family protein [Gemmatimonadota bacterium]|nr:DoxX family protein [Gemmatimonadota bacterium]
MRQLILADHLPAARRISFTLLRVFAAAVYMQHGAQKMFGVLGGYQNHPGATAPLASLSGLAMILEIFSGGCILLGLFSRPAAFLSSGEMAVAYFRSHARRSFWPVVNHGEPAVLLCFIFLYVAAFGAGPHSLDALLLNRRGGGQRVD